MNKTNNYAFSGITDKIIKAFYKVYNNLGYGFLEKVYEKAIIWELEKEGIPFQKQMPIMIFYDGRNIGKFIPDLIIEEKVVVEIKAVSCLLQCHEDQLRNALRASGMEVGLLLNFGIQPQIKRKVFSNEFKKGIMNESMMDLNHKNPS